MLLASLYLYIKIIFFSLLNVFLIPEFHLLPKSTHRHRDHMFVEIYPKVIIWFRTIKIISKNTEELTACGIMKPNYTCVVGPSSEFLLQAGHDQSATTPPQEATSLYPLTPQVQLPR